MKLSVWVLILGFLMGSCKAPENTAVSPEPSATSIPTQTGAPPSAQGKLLVVTTVAPLTNIVSNIAGDRVDVKGIIPSGTDSHTPKKLQTFNIPRFLGVLALESTAFKSLVPSNPRIKKNLLPIVRKDY